MANDWKVDENTATLKLDEECVLYVSRIEGGISIKVKDVSGDKPKILYTKTIGDLQLGVRPK